LIFIVVISHHVFTLALRPADRCAEDVRKRRLLPARWIEDITPITLTERKMDASRVDVLLDVIGVIVIFFRKGR